ncbi:DMT family transporter [Anaerosporobacter sp.]|uniref:DMT family transporter n=1 Tax=Anaerosporobacter sp. TaxID=1872529 RepID=UPI00286F44A2|nr:DMT family transporter [Anaerosporobacter sp.]
MALFAAVACGITVVISRTTNAQLSKHISNTASTFYNYITGFIVSLVVLLVSREIAPHFVFPTNLNGYVMFFGGIVGVFSVLLSNYITPKISAFQLTIILFVSQIFTAIIIDWLRYDTLSVGKILGGILVLFGLIYNTYIDFKQERLATQE